MSSRMKEVRQPHWAVPHLYRVRTPAIDLYPYLSTGESAAGTG